MAYEQSCGQPKPPKDVPAELTTGEFTNLNRTAGGFEGGDDRAQDAALAEFAPLGKREKLSAITGHESVTIPSEGGPDSQRS